MRKNKNTIVCVQNFKQELCDTEVCTHEQAYNKVVDANIKLAESYTETLKSKSSDVLRAYEQSKIHYQQAVQQWVQYLQRA